MTGLVFLSDTMDCGKSILALQTACNHERRDMRGLLYNRNDRAGTGRLSSRIGLESRAFEVDENIDFWRAVARERTDGREIDFLTCGEVRFCTEAQIEQLAKIVDEIEVDIFGSRITSDFMTRLFPGSARMAELADRVEVLQVGALCWCGRCATHNVRTVDSAMVTGGEQVIIGDTNAGKAGYEVPYRYHHIRRMTASAARATKQLPLDES